MKEIKLTQGNIAFVDDEDFEYLKQLRWRLGTKGYAESSIKNRTVLMHRLILKQSSNMITDHIDHNKLNNQKYNLRICTIAENNRNRKSQGTSKYLGVYLRNNKYIASISKNGRTFHLGTFENEIEAAMIYDSMAKKFHGEFANLNFK